MSFTPLPITGDVSRRIDANAVRQSLYNLIKTQFYERPFQPEIGSPMYRLLFEPIDPITTNALKQGLERLIQNFEPRVVLQQIEVLPKPDENAYNISIFFYVVGIGTPVTFTTVLTRLR